MRERERDLNVLNRLKDGFKSLNLVRECSDHFVNIFYNSKVKGIKTTYKC